MPGFTESEPEFLISYLDRHEDWAVVVCLVGGGQEINTGEAGIGAWIDACLNRFAHWHLRHFRAADEDGIRRGRTRAAGGGPTGRQFPISSSLLSGESVFHGLSDD